MGNARLKPHLLAAHYTTAIILADGLDLPSMLKRHPLIILAKVKEQLLPMFGDKILRDAKN